jgi:hypothetical protein
MRYAYNPATRNPIPVNQSEIENPQLKDPHPATRTPHPASRIFPEKCKASGINADTLN